MLFKSRNRIILAPGNCRYKLYNCRRPLLQVWKTVGEGMAYTVHVVLDILWVKRSITLVPLGLNTDDRVSQMVHYSLLSALLLDQGPMGIRVPFGTEVEMDSKRSGGGKRKSTSFNNTAPL